MEKTLKVLASLFWILGLTATIIGLNIKTDTGKWVSTIGNITFLVGLALQGVVWALMSRNKKSPEEESSEPESEKQGILNRTR